MTEDIDNTLKAMLAIQKDLQESQIKLQGELNDLKDTCQDLKDTCQDLKDTSKSQQEILGQLIQYIIINERKHLRTEDKLLELEEKINQLS
jgi:uncharacterized protein YukE